MKKTSQVDPLNDNLFFGMIRFSLPVVAVSLLTMLFSCADMAVIGRFGHENAVAAIGASSSVIALIVGAVTALPIGVTVTIGQLYGKKDMDEINSYVNSLSLTAIIISVIPTVVMEIFAPQILTLIDCPDVIFTDALIYFRIYFLALPLISVYTFLNACLEAGGDSFHPLLFQLLTFSINICLNLVFVILLDRNVFGVAIATLISQFMCCLCCVFYLCKQKNELSFHPLHQHLLRNSIPFWKIGIPSLLESIFMSLTGVVISGFMNSFSPDVIAGNAIAQTVEGIIVVSFVGFSSASVVFISQNFGSRNYERVKKCVLYSISTAFIIGEALGILVYLLSDQLLLLFTTSETIIEFAKLRMLFMCPFFGLCGTMNIISGCIRGMGDSQKPLIISIVCSVIFRLSWLFFVAIPKNSLSLGFLCFPVCWGMITLLGIIAFIYDYRKSA